MARPRKTGLDYFPHDTDAASDEKIDALMCKHGAAGYAVYFYLLERIYRNGGTLPLTNYSLEIYSAKLRIGADYLRQIIDDAVRLECFDKNAYKKGLLTSSGIERRVFYIQKNREKWRVKTQIKIENESAEKFSQEKTRFSLGKIELSQEKIGFSPEKTPQIKENKIKIKERERENNKRERESEICNDQNPVEDNPTLSLSDSLPPSQNNFSKNTLDSVLQIIYANIKQDNYTDKDIQAFFDYYQSQGWKHSNGQDVSDIPTAFKRWLRRRKKEELSEANEMKKKEKQEETIYTIQFTLPNRIRTERIGVSYLNGYIPTEAVIRQFMREYLRAYFPQFFEKTIIDVSKTGEKAFTVSVKNESEVK